MGRTSQTDGNKPEKVKKAKKSAESDKTAPAEGEIKKPHRFRPGTVALRQIRKMQKTTDFLLRKGPVQRIIREKMTKLDEKRNREWTDKTKPCIPLRIRKGAIPLLQEASERNAVNTFGKAYKMSLHTKRVTLYDRDIDLLVSVLANDSTANFPRTSRAEVETQ